MRWIERNATSDHKTERALLHGWLKEVGPDKRSGQLHDGPGGYTRLVFDSELSREMERLVGQFVEVRGCGRFDADDEWIDVKVDSISEAPSGREPFDLDAVLNDPNPKLFDPENVVTASEPFDVDEFVRVIHEERDVGGSAGSSRTGAGHARTRGEIPHSAALRSKGLRDGPFDRLRTGASRTGWDGSWLRGRPSP